MSTAREREALEERLVELLYDELPPAEAKALRAQLAEHPEVAERLAQWQALRRAAAEVPELEPDPQVRYDILRAARLATDEAAGEASKPPWWAFLVNLSFAPALAALGLVVLGAGMLVVLTRTYEDAAIPRQEAPAAAAPSAAQAPQPAGGEAPAAGEAEPAKAADEAAGTETLAKGGAAAPSAPEAQADDGDENTAVGDAPAEPADSAERDLARRRALEPPADPAPVEPPTYAQAEDGRESKAAPKMPARLNLGDDLDPTRPAEARTRDRAPAEGAKTAAKDDAPAPPSKKRKAARRPAPRAEAPPQAEDGLLDDLSAAPGDRFAPPPPPAPSRAPRRAEPTPAPEPEPVARPQAATPPPAVAEVAEEAPSAPADEAEPKAKPKAEEKAAEAERAATGADRAPAEANTSIAIGAARPDADDGAGAGPSRGAPGAGDGAQATLQAARSARDRGDLRTAAARYESFLSANPGFPGLQGVMFETAQTYERLGDTGRARQLYRLVVGGGGALAGQAQLRLNALDRAAEQQKRDPPRAKPQPNARPRKSSDAEALEQK